MATVGRARWGSWAGVLLFIIAAGCAPAPGPSPLSSTQPVVDGETSATPTTRPAAILSQAAPLALELHEQTLAVDYGVTCSLQPDGTLGCWGGGGDTLPAGTFKALDVDYDTGCAIRTDGTLVCWGSDPEDGLDAAPLPPGTFFAVDGGPASGCAIRTDTTLVCWGTQAKPPLGRFVRVAVGSDADFEGDLSACALGTEGAISCWGDEGATPPAPPAGLFIDMDLGSGHACAVRADGAAVCWGELDRDMDFGQTRAPSGSFTAIAVGDRHSCAIRVDGTVACWGNDGFGQSSPPAGTFTSIVAGSTHTCGARTSGALVCWGDDATGSVALEPGAMRTGSSASIPAIAASAVSVATGTVCIIRPDGTLACWGHASSPPAGRFEAVVAGSVYNGGGCAIRVTGALVCWGFGPDEIYAAENPGDYPAGSFSGPPGGRYTALSMSEWGAGCAVREDGQIKCWGGLPSGPRGHYTDVAVTTDGACGLRATGRIVCWAGEWSDTPTPPQGTFVALADDEPCGITAEGQVVCAEGGTFGPKSESFRQVSGPCGLDAGGRITCVVDPEYDDSNAPGIPAGHYRSFSQGSDGGCGILQDGDLTCWDQAALVVSDLAPRATILVPHRSSADPTVPAIWSANTPESPVASYDVRYRRADAPLNWTTWLRNTTTTTSAIRLEPSVPGRAYQLQVRARTADGRLSDWAEVWTTQPADDTALTATRGWTRITDARLYEGSAWRTTRKAARLSTSIDGTNFDLVATTCPSCGKIRVSLERTPDQEEGAGVDAPEPVVIDLRSARTTPRRLLDVFFDDTDPAVWGTVVIEVLSSGRPVVIDGYVIN